MCVSVRLKDLHTYNKIVNYYLKNELHFEDINYGEKTQPVYQFFIQYT